ncbi:MAG: hypothetical protein Q9214_001421 [Letrouitia sp. 1 TL-2023]
MPPPPHRVLAQGLPPEPEAKVARMGEAQVEEDELRQNHEEPQWRGCGSGGCGRRDCRTTDGTRIGLRQARAGSASCYYLIN